MHLFIFVLLLQCQYAFGAKILFFYSHESLSHIISMKPYLENLVEAGHHVTVMQSRSTNKTLNLGANVEVMPVTVTNSYANMMGDFQKSLWSIESDGLTFGIVMGMNEETLAKHFHQTPREMQILINEKWDLIVVDALFTNQGFAVASYLNKKNGTPYISFCTTFIFSFVTWPLNTGGSWSSTLALTTGTPNDSNDFYRPSSFFHRLKNFYGNLMTNIGCHFILPLTSFKETRKYSVKDFNLENFLTRSAGIIGDGIYGFGNDIPESSGIVNAGHYCGKVKQLPSDLRQFVEDEKSLGTIYVAFGSFIAPSTAPQEIIQELFGALNQLSGYRIIFTFSNANHLRHLLKSHIKLVDWAPQFDILSHPKTKLFFSHGGLKSVKESICAARPITVMPLFAEQARNAKLVATRGFGTIVNKYNLTKEAVFNALTMVLNNSHYQESVQKYRNMYLSMNPIPLLDKARFFTEKIIRKKGQKHKQNYFRGETVSNFAFFNLDVIVVVMSMLYIVTKS